ncbi:MAG: ClpXP protease specificity-enhancing factor [Ottowia sp.]|nr:ClpXP protease specificity-enhancing factor [Ottowia sp.]
MATANTPPSVPSVRPYLIRALYEWCTDSGFTPLMALYVDENVQVPREYVKNNEIVLNISFEASRDLKIGNQYVEFKTRFGGVTHAVMAPVGCVTAVYARENGQGMSFPYEQAPPAVHAITPQEAGGSTPKPPTPPSTTPRKRPALKRIK